MVGGNVSMVTASAADGSEFSASGTVEALETRIVMRCWPPESGATGARFQVPTAAPSCTALLCTPSTKRRTYEPSGTVPVNVGSPTLVMLSVLLNPPSLAAVRSGAPGVNAMYTASSALYRPAPLDVS